MSKANEFQDHWLDEMGGESLEGSGFEAQIPDEVYSNDRSPAEFRSSNEKEPNDVH